MCMGNLQMKDPMCGQIFSIVVHIVRSGTDEQCVITTRAIPPVTYGMNTLMLHITNARGY